jgi:glucose/arabinose dehydrogenase
MRNATRALSLVALLTACGKAHAPPDTARSPTSSASIGRTVLTTTPENPMALAVTPDGDVYYIERTGSVRLYHHTTGAVTDALVLDVDTSHENGLLGLALPPDFAASRAVFLYYSAPLADPLPADGPPGRNVVARFVANADGSLDPNSRSELLAVPSERQCCHEGGALAFGPDGALFLSVGDNTNPFASSGFAPLDRRPGRETFNAERTAANPFDLRGKILRILPDGGIPPGNLFPMTGEVGRPEIFAMGVRNPFRTAIDPETGALYWGDIGPDANDDASAGPRGLDEINRTFAPGDFGWPHCIGFAQPYSLVDFTTGAIGAPFDCKSTVPALLAYDYATPSYAALGTTFGPGGEFLGRSAMAGTVYRASESAPFALPPSYDGALIMTDWTRNIVAAVRTDENGALSGVERLFPDELFERPIDVEVGLDGALYVLDYGSGFWGDNSDAELSRVEYGDALSPRAVLHASRTSGSAPLSVDFSATDSRAFGDSATLSEYAWDFDGDAKPDAFGPAVTHVFDANGTFSVALRVRSSNGKQSLPVATNIVVGNSPPSVHITSPDPNAVLVPGVPVTLAGTAHDPEDGDAACDELVWNISLGHNTHSHPLTTVTGCATTFVPDLGDHGSTASTDVLFYAVELVYTDHGGANGEAPLTAREGLRLDAAR